MLVLLIFFLPHYLQLEIDRSGKYNCLFDCTSAHKSRQFLYFLGYTRCSLHLWYTNSFGQALADYSNINNDHIVILTFTLSSRMTPNSSGHGASHPLPAKSPLRLFTYLYDSTYDQHWHSNGCIGKGFLPYHIVAPLEHNHGSLVRSGERYQ